jgi:hypothetical protein
MRQHDQQRFAKHVSEFIDGCGIEPPLYSKASNEPLERRPDVVAGRP